MGKNLIRTVLASGLAGAFAMSESGADDNGRLFLLDSQFTPAVTRIFEVDPLSAVLVLKGDLGLAYTPALGMAAADAQTFYLAGTDTSGSNLCQGTRSCLLLKVVLDPNSTTPALIQQVGVITDSLGVVPEITGMTFRNDGRLYAVSQLTSSLYRVDVDTAAATRIGSTGIPWHGGDVTFDEQDRLFGWTNNDSASGVYLIDPVTGNAGAYELHPNLDMAGMAALQHGDVVYGASAGTDQLYTMNLMGSLSGVLMTLGGLPFHHERGDLDSPYCEDDASCADADVCSADTCSPGGCRHNPIPGCCVSDSQCDDGNACTLDQCESNQCSSIPLNLDDSNPCTLDQCDPATGPSHVPIIGCCNSDLDCNDLNTCTLDSCQSNSCVYERLPVSACGGTSLNIRPKNRRIASQDGSP